MQYCGHVCYSFGTETGDEHRQITEAIVIAVVGLCLYKS